MLFNKEETNRGLSPLTAGVHKVELTQVRVDRQFGCSLIFRFVAENGCGYEHRVNLEGKVKDSQYKFVFDLIYLIYEAVGVDVSGNINQFKDFDSFVLGIDKFLASVGTIPRTVIYIKLVKQENNGKTFVGFNPMKPPFISNQNTLSYSSDVDDKVNIYNAMSAATSDTIFY